MKNILLAVPLIVFSVIGNAQNRTFGVGTTTLNPNAALQVESPANNQGFIMPRLTTVQRTAMNPNLGATDVGLLVYDRDLNSIFIWNGTQWAGASRLALPYTDSVVTAPANSNLLSMYYAGTALGNVGVARFENLNATNAFSPLFVRTGGTGSASNFIINNASNTGSAVNGSTNGAGRAIQGINTGTGSAGGFVISNVANPANAVFVQTNGTGPGININMINTANSAPGLSSVTSGSGPAVFGRNQGSADGFAGLFSNTNATNTFPAVQAHSAGPGSAFRAFQTTGSGPGIDIFMQNASGTAPGLVTNQSGLGPGAIINMANAASSAAGININHSGTGHALVANRPIQATQFIGDGSLLTNLPAVSFPFNTSVGSPATLFEITNSSAGRAGTFRNTNPSATEHALVGESTGVALSAGVFGLNNGNGFGVLGRANGTVFGSAAVYGEQLGTGDAAGAFRINNPANTLSGLYGETNGSGSALFANNLGTGRGAQIQIDNVANTQVALRAFTNGTGSAGFFTVQNAASTASAVRVETNGFGYSFEASRTGGSGDVIFANWAGTSGAGSAGNFRNSLTTNGAATLYASTNAENGTALGMHNVADGNAFTIFQGGIQLSALSVTAPVTLTRKSALYEVTGTGNINLPATGSVGEMCWVSNASGGSITVNSGPTVLNGTIRQFIRLTGGWQIVN